MEEDNLRYTSAALGHKATSLCSHGCTSMLVEVSSSMTCFRIVSSFSSASSVGIPCRTNIQVLTQSKTSQPASQPASQSVTVACVHVASSFAQQASKLVHQDLGFAMDAIVTHLLTRPFAKLSPA